MPHGISRGVIGEMVPAPQRRRSRLPEIVGAILLGLAWLAALLWAGGDAIDQIPPPATAEERRTLDPRIVR